MFMQRTTPLLEWTYRYCWSNITPLQQVNVVKTEVKVQKYLLLKVLEYQKLISFMSMHCFIIVLRNTCNTSEATYNTLHRLELLEY